MLIHCSANIIEKCLLKKSCKYLCEGTWMFNVLPYALHHSVYVVYEYSYIIIQ